MKPSEIQALESGADPGERKTRMDPLQAKQQMTLAEFRSLGPQPEAHPTAFPAPLHQPHALERLQMPGRTRLRQSNGHGQVTHALVGPRQGHDQPEARSLAEAGEDRPRAGLVRT